MHPKKLTTPVRGAAGALALAAAVLAVPATASAAAPERFNFDDTAEFDFPACSGAPYDVHAVARETGTGTIHTRGGATYYDVRWSGHNTLTNTVTGKSVEIYADFHDKDSKIVDNGDGTFAIDSKTIINERDYTPDGALAFKTSGKFEWHSVIDTMGTPGNVDDDEVISEDLLRFSGRNDRDGVDFCAWFDQVTT